jgi:glycosyltransferase involved in cell wall biosynthesis
MNPWGLPLGAIPKTATKDFKAALRRKLLGRKYDTILIGGIHVDMATWVRELSPSSRVIVDFIDSPTLFNRRQMRPGGIARAFDKYQVWKTKRFELRARRASDAVIYISDIDATTALPKGSAFVMPNGVLTEDHEMSTYDKKAAVARIAFLGNMGYEPNIQAAVLLARDILPLIRRSRQGVSLLVIGRNPAPRVLSLKSPEIEVTGTVANIWPLVRSADVCVFPMMSGAGLQNKILDAMLGCVPVVASSIAAQGLGFTNGRELLVANTPEEFSHSVLAILEEPELGRRLVSEASAALRQRYSWEAIAKRYENILTASY